MPKRVDPPANTTKTKNDTRMTKQTRARRATPKPPATPSHDRIAVRAYEIYTSGEGNSPFDDWIRAERELVTIR